MRRLFPYLCLSFLIFGADAGGSSQRLQVSPVVIDYFYEVGCPECNRVREQVLPELEERFEELYLLNSRDVGIKSNVVMLMSYQEKLGMADNAPVCMVVDCQYALNGFDAIKTGLLVRVEECATARMEPGWKAPETIAAKPEPAAGLAAERAKRFTLPMVLAAGFLDGINHCAISTIVFFMSLLAVSKVRGRAFLMMGIPFCLASFLTYFAIGLGLLRALQTLSGFPYLRIVLNAGVTVVLVVLAFLSFRDAIRYRRTGDPRDVALQLPQRVKTMIHSVMRAGVGRKAGDIRPGEERKEGNVPSWRLVVGGLVIGTLVTALEGVCTGQVYVPTLAMLAKSGQEPGRAVSYLLAYNLVSDVPLWAVLVLAYYGIRTTTLIEWSKKNVVFSKTLTGVLFLAMAVVVALL